MSFLFYFFQSPWGAPVLAPAPCSLADVMSEQLARQLHEEGSPFPEIPDTDLDLTCAPEADTSSDLMLAQMLQMEFDREFDTQLRREEKKFNGDSKVSISFENYRMVHPYEDSDSSEDEVDWQDTRHDPYRADKPTTTPKKGFVGKGKNITTKHDEDICGRKNTARMDNFAPEVQVGDGIGMDLKLSNQVYNALKRHCHTEQRRSARLHEKKEHSTAEQAVDPRTRLLMYKMVNAGILENINGCISTGKESVVFHANGGRCVLCIIVCASTRLSLAINVSVHLLSTLDIHLLFSVSQMMQRLYQDCNLVHADLSEYNMLWHDGQVWFIDVSQSIEPTHPHGLEFLFRDCRNVATFFQKAGVAEALNVFELFNTVSELQINSDNEADFLAQIEALEKRNEDHVQKSGKKIFMDTSEGNRLYDRPDNFRCFL
uniref:Serine/threonine-protein kinase RIO3 n=1 Tax=Sinocyclocheilus rhinocerous TaxID=307959 RepID=A0A673MBJ3_9TELE